MYTFRYLSVIGAGIALAGCGGGSGPDGSSGDPSEPPGSGNRPPSISGNPSAAVVVGVAYEFTPVASDPDGQSLSFTVTNKPAWLAFEPNSGRVTGVPSAAHVGTHPGIIISASDGALTSSLPSFSIQVSPAPSGSATVSWSVPVKNVDGTPIADLEGYRVHYGLSSSGLSQTLEIPDRGVTSATIDNLGSGTWYFGVSAYTTNGGESAISKVASKIIN